MDGREPCVADLPQAAWRCRCELIKVEVVAHDPGWFEKMKTKNTIGGAWDQERGLHKRWGGCFQLFFEP